MTVFFRFYFKSFCELPINSQSYSVSVLLCVNVSLLVKSTVHVVRYFENIVIGQQVSKDACSLEEKL